MTDILFFHSYFQIIFSSYHWFGFLTRFALEINLSGQVKGSLRGTSAGLVLTLISMFPTFAVERMMGLPTSAGKMCSGKLEPA